MSKKKIQFNAHKFLEHAIFRVLFEVSISFTKLFISMQRKLPNFAVLENDTVDAA